MQSLAGTTLKDRYFLRKRIGSGGMADVFLAWDRLRSTQMAVKVLRRDLAQNDAFVGMFAKEAKLLRELEHPHIVRLYEFEQENDIVFIVMEWVEGTNLNQLLQERKKPLPLADVARVLTPVCSALNYAHQNRVYHCDVKPSNIMLHVDGRVLLTDFGVARFTQDDAEGGTPPYMAPEQFNANPVDARTDVYAMGVTLYEMLAGGNLPFRGDSPVSQSQGTTLRARIAWEHQFLPVPPLRQSFPGTPESVDQVVATAMHKERDRRYPTTMALRDAFDRAIEQAMREAPSDRSVWQTNVTPPSGRQDLSGEAQPRPPVQPPPQVQPQQMGSQPVKPVRAVANPRGPHLFCRKGEFAGQCLPIPQEGLAVGRSAACQLRLNEPTVSRSHAKIFCGRRGMVYLRDEKSSVGTFVNGVKIGDAAVVLKQGDIIQFGFSQVFEFRIGA